MTARAPRLFGTDGIRGPAGEGSLAPEALVALGRAVAATLRSRGARRDGRPPRVLLGRDTRVSGPMVAGALAAGLQAGGATVEDGGVLSTPAVALLVRRRRFEAGAALSASHNPPPDNGVKLLGPDGEKVDEAFEREVERRLPAARRPPRAGAPPAPGRLRPDAADEYAAAVLEEFKGLSLRRLAVVVDAAEGAASAVAPEVLRHLGAAVHPHRCGGHGATINESCGALHPGPAGRAVRRHRADLGLALDGDADRLVLLDEKGRPRDGDDFLAAVAPRLKERGRLPGDAVAGTVMCNGGLDRHLRARGIALVRTPVGDRFVAEAIRERGLGLGAEPSGHILIPRGGLLTSDGLVSALWVMREMVRTRRSLSDLLRGFERVPRAEAAVRVARRTPLDRVGPVREALRAAEETVGREGRVLVRYSGTEPKVRILAESPRRAAAERACADLARAVAGTLGPEEPKKRK